MTDFASYNSIVFSAEATFESNTGGIVTKDFLQTPPSNASVSDVWHSAQSSQWVRTTVSGCVGSFFTWPVQFSRALFFTNFASSSQNGGQYYHLDHHSSPGNVTVLLHGSWLFSLNDDMFADFLTGDLSLVPYIPSNTSRQPYSTDLSANYNLQTIDQTSVEYCLAENAYLNTTELVPQLLIVVIICSILIAALSSIVFFQSSPLVTIGDAIASFLDTPDPITRNMGPLSVTEWQKQISNRGSRRDSPVPSAQNTVWKTRNRFYLSSVSRPRWYLTMSL